MTKGKPLKENKDEVILALAQGVPQSDIAAKYGVTEGAVSKYKKSHIVEVRELATGFLHDAAGLSGTILVDILRILKDALSRANSEVTLKDALALIKELRSTAAVTLDRKADITNINVSTGDTIVEMTDQEWDEQLALLRKREKQLTGKVPGGNRSRGDGKKKARRKKKKP